MANVSADLFQEITVGATEDTIIIKDYRKSLYFTADEDNSGTIKVAVGPGANIDNGRPIKAGERQPFTLEPGQILRVKGSEAGQKFVITG